MIEDNLKRWFKQHRRDLPWRDDPTPYHVWVSEIMLQQTQVSVVIPYYLKWMEQFPTISALASAPIELVLKCWEGLGYYSRARHLHEGAKRLVNDFGGALTIEALDYIKGIGPYTKGAILNFAFKKRALALDGNVMRVLARLFGMRDPIDQSTTKRELTRRLEEIIPEEEPWLVSEGLIELGALCCTKTKPQCVRCPLQPSCLAYRHQSIDQIPCKSKRVVTTPLTRYVAVICWDHRLLVNQVEEGKVMGGLYEFPYFEDQRDQAEALGLTLTPHAVLPQHTHTFTRYRVTLYSTLYLTNGGEVKGQWRDKNELDQLPFSAGHRQVLLSAIKKLGW